MNERKKISLPIIVEGRYDKSTLLSMFDATVITTDGFGIFNSKEKRALITRLSEKGIILLTDSDGGGRQIRSYLSGFLPKEKLHHLYIPEIFGKERRKKTHSKAGLLGVEGMTREVLERVLSPFIVSGDAPCVRDERKLTKLDLFLDGLSGSDGSEEKRKRLAAALGFPSDMSANSLIEAINLAVGYEEYKRILNGLFEH